MSCNDIDLVDLLLKRTDDVADHQADPAAQYSAGAQARSVAALIEEGLMAPAGLDAFARRDPKRAGIVGLDGFEIATRLSYLLLGTTPDEALLDKAQAGMLDVLLESQPHASVDATFQNLRNQLRAFVAGKLAAFAIPKNDSAFSAAPPISPPTTPAAI